MSTVVGVISTHGTQRVTAVVDSGAAQSAVSATWLRAHPDLWAMVVPTKNKFSGLVGEVLETDGMVRLTIDLSGFQFQTWVHVFPRMVSDLLLGTNTLIEQGMVIDAAKRVIYSTSQPQHTSPLAYRLSINSPRMQIISERAPVTMQNESLGLMPGFNFVNAKQ